MDGFLTSEAQAADMARWDNEWKRVKDSAARKGYVEVIL